MVFASRGKTATVAAMTARAVPAESLHSVTAVAMESCNPRKETVRFVMAITEADTDRIDGVRR